MLNIVMPMAGSGTRFKVMGGNEPKPLVKIHGIPMGVAAALSMRPQREHRFIFLFLQEHIDNYGIDVIFRKWFPHSVVIPIAEVTQGAACTVLKAKDFIDNTSSLMIANCDQWIGCDIDNYLKALDDYPEADILVMTTSSNKPSHSYVKYDKYGCLVGMVEKEVVSDEATIGIYNCRYGKDWVWAAREMMRENKRYKGEFYVAPAFNYLMERLRKHMITARYENIYFLGIPQEVKDFLNQEVSEKIKEYQID